MTCNQRPRTGIGRFLLTTLLFATLTPAAFPAEPSVDLERRKGNVVVVDFWASWCVPCRRSFPWLNEMQAKYRDQGLVIIGVNVDSQRADADKFLAEVPARFEIVYDHEGKLPASFGVTAMPSSFIFDRKGELATKHLGFQNARRAEYEAVLQELLKTPRPASPTPPVVRSPGSQQ